MDVSIDEKDLYESGLSFGAMCRVIDDEEETLFPGKEKIKGSSALFVAAFFLSKNLEDTEYEAAVLSFVDVIKERAIMARSDKPLSFPQWDPSQVEFVPYTVLADVAIALTAWNKSADDNLGLQVGQYLGPLFSCSGSLMSGIRDGYEERNEYKGLIEKYKEKFYAMVEGENDQEKRNLIKRQLRAIRGMLEK